MGINIQNVKFYYTKNKPLFNNLNLNINDNPEIITIVGSTGSGKSTLAQLMNAILLPQEGIINIFDKTITYKKHKKLKEIRKDVGLVFQFSEYQLFEETVLKDVMFGPSNYKELRIDAKEKALNALEKMNVDSALYEKSPFNLSGGQMRKVAIAGILSLDPKILILDEPTVGLDSKAKEDLINLLIKLNKEQNKTIIIITHDMDLLTKVANRVIVLNEGKITFDGTPNILFNNLELLKENSLNLPIISNLAVKLKEEGLIDFNSIPLTIDEILEDIRKYE